MQSTIRLTSAARAGVIVAANDLTSHQRAGSSTKAALADATNAINAEEASPTSTRAPSRPPTTTSASPRRPRYISGGVTISVVTITISHSSISLVPFVVSLPVTTHATARYS